MSPFRFAPLTGAALPRRSFLLYSGAAGGLWLAGCADKKDPSPTAPAPTIASFAPASGAPGTAVTITGTNFTGTTTVTISGQAAQFTLLNATTLAVLVPAAAQTGAIAITTPGGTATSSTAFAVLPATSGGITGFMPGSGAPGTVVTVMGSGLAGATAVTVGGVAATFTVVNATTLTLTVPATASTGLIVVTTPGGSFSSSTTFTVLPPTLVNVGTGDVGILNYAYALEQLEAAFYAQVKAATVSGFSASEKAYFDQVAAHEAIHRDFFKAAINRDAPGSIIPELTPDFSTITFTDRTSVLGAAKGFEDLGVAAYNGVAKLIRTAAYLVIAGQIVSVEARHAAYIRDLVSPGSFAADDQVDPNTGLDKAMAPADVALIVNSFLAVGSKLDVSGIR